jgi:hypothetical protein
MRKVQGDIDPLYDYSEAGADEAVLGLVGSLLLIGLAVWNLSTYAG